MVVLDFEQKDVFISTTQSQNLGRLLSSVCREAQDVIRELALKTDAQQSEDPLLAGSTLITNNARQELWERVRMLRELYLKCIVLVMLHKDSSNISDLVQLGAAMWDTRETVRRRAQEFYEIQWPPMGSFPPPQPPWALDVAVNILVSQNPRTLPKYAQLAVEQTGTNTVYDAIKNIRLPLKTRKAVGQRLTDIIRAEYALALSKTEELKLRTLKFVNFRLEMGRVHLESKGEFHVTFFTDFRRYQFERYRVLVGGGANVSPELEIMGGNTLQSACNIVIETFENLKKRALYEVNGWKALINACKETRQKSKDLRMLAKWLSRCHGLKEKTKVPKSSLNQILLEDLYKKVIEAGQVLPETVNFENVVEDLHHDENAALFEGGVEAAVEERIDEEEDEDLDQLTGNLYDALWRMEKDCLAKLIEEREIYQSVESNQFTFEFYRFVVLLAARIARYGSLLILRDQARNMTRCTAAPGGVIHVREWREQPDFKKWQSTEESEGGGKGWRSLFAKYFTPPPNCPASLAEEYPEVKDIIPFSNLFPVSALPVHTDYVDIDFLPGLPIAVLSQILETEHEEKICRLRFGLDQSQAELFVVLEPLDTVVRAFNARNTSSESMADKPSALEYVMSRLREMPELSHFYAANLKEHGSSSLIKGFGGRYLDLTEWISYAYEILSCLILQTISYEVEKREKWTVLHLSDSIELIYESFRSVKIHINLLTGYININPIISKWVDATAHTPGVDMILEHTDLLLTSLNEGNIDKFLTILEMIEHTLSNQSNTTQKIREEIILDDDVVSEHNPKRSKIQ